MLKINEIKLPWLCTLKLSQHSGTITVTSSCDVDTKRGKGNMKCNFTPVIPEHGNFSGTNPQAPL
jgi:hypothetical protein